MATPVDTPCAPADHHAQRVHLLQAMLALAEKYGSKERVSSLGEEPAFEDFALAFHKTGEVRFLPQVATNSCVVPSRTGQSCAAAFPASASDFPSRKHGGVSGSSRSVTDQMASNTLAKICGKPSRVQNTRLARILPVAHVPARLPVCITKAMTGLA